MNIYNILEKKRDGYCLKKDEINYIIDEYMAGKMPDYQMSALLMAIFIRGMNKEEVFYLTQAMTASGDTISLDFIDKKVIDKHSTGGVGDNTSIIISPLVASCGVPVAKLSGRGLGHTGGTIDKLESIKGFRTSLSMDEFVDNVRKSNIALMGQSKNIAPADGKIYSLRDVSATVDSIALIASSIMSKKLAIKSDCIVLDVKLGKGAFIKEMDEAIELSRLMIDIGKKSGVRLVAYITNMNQPLGFYLGNSLEVWEAMEVLKGKDTSSDLYRLSILLACQMVKEAKRISYSEAKEEILMSIEKGKAFDKFKEFVLNQDGELADGRYLLDSPFKKDVFSYESGYISELDAKKLGEVLVYLGAGRKCLNDVPDLYTGIKLNKKIGDKVEKGEKLASLYGKDMDLLDRASDYMFSCYGLEEKIVEKEKLVYAYLDEERIIRY